MKIPKFKPLKARLRATFAGNQLGGKVRLGEIDTENEVLHDVQITLEGEAKGHGVWLDREFCEAVAAQGNATGEVGLKVRYGHPAMCADAIGTELGRAKNFRVVDIERDLEDGTHVTAAGVVADVYLLKSAHSAPQGDIAKHVLECAAEDPTQFGQSIVFTYADFKSTDKDGKAIKCSEFESEGDFFEAAGENKVFAVLGKLHGTDFTDTPAATDGVFSTNTLAEEAVEMLDEHPEIYDAIEHSPKSVVEFLERTGLMSKIESARVAGMQAAKDKEIAALKAEAEDYKRRSIEALAQAEAEQQRLSALVEEKDLSLAAKDGEIEDLKADIGAKSQALEVAGGDIKQLEAKCAEAEKALAEKQAALDAEIERYREQVGSALAQPGSKKAELKGRELLASSIVVAG